MVLLEFAMAPHGQGESLSAHVARILDVIDKSGVRYQLTPMGTILEGDWWWSLPASGHSRRIAHASGST
jgi:uncharacterized protein YqgV (UPF0045/DUF77 family)